MTSNATFAHQSYIGDRELNEDRAAIVERPDSTLLILADGLGGHAGGEIASQALVDAVSETFLGLTEEQLKEPKSFMTLAVNYAHKFIHRRASEEGMLDYVPKTTCVLALLVDNVLLWCHVGDSRLYIVRDEMIIFHTSDHIAKGYGKNAPINRCVGGVERPIPAISEPMLLEDGDIVFLCSDGAWKNLTVEDLNRIEKSFPQPDLDILLRKLERRNSYPSDNVSASMLCWGQAAVSSVTESEQRAIDEKVQAELDSAMENAQQSESAPRIPPSKSGNLDDAINQIESFIKDIDSKL
ncbi:MAG: PP2C family protein-serine/threonine phosphatase [Arenicella sp.]